MRIKKVRIPLDAQEKIFKKHGVKREEIESVFFDRPYYFKTRDKRYMAIGFIGKYITIVFNYCEGIAEVVTAYCSSKWQKKLYKVKK